MRLIPRDPAPLSVFVAGLVNAARRALGPSAAVGAASTRRRGANLAGARVVGAGEVSHA